MLLIGIFYYYYFASVKSENTENIFLVFLSDKQILVRKSPHVSGYGVCISQLQSLSMETENAVPGTSKHF